MIVFATNGAEIEFPVGIPPIGAEMRRKLEELADEKGPISWEMIEDRGLFGIFRRPGPAPTHDDIVAFLAMLPPVR